MGRHSGVWLGQQNIWEERNLENVENEKLIGSYIEMDLSGAVSLFYVTPRPLRREQRNYPLSPSYVPGTTSLLYMLFHLSS